MSTALTADELRSRLLYEQDTGLFKWIARATSRVPCGAMAGTINNEGYRAISINNRSYLAHRLAWLYVYGEWPMDQIDHINGVKTDNRISNLRNATRSTNCQNLRAAKSNNKVGLLGVTRDRGRFRAAIKDNGKQRFLGYFATAEAASAAYLLAKRECHAGCTI